METVKRSTFISYQFEIQKDLPILTVYVPNSQKFHKDFYEIFQFEIACIGQRDIPVFLMSTFKLDLQ